MWWDSKSPDGYKKWPVYVIEAKSQIKQDYPFGEQIRWSSAC